MGKEAQTPRRSTRFQPLVVGKPSSTEDDNSVTWVGSPIRSRTTRKEDLYDDDEVEIDNATTSFYSGFSMLCYSPQAKKGKRKLEEETFSIGDCVLVKTQAKLPSIGVIISMWGVSGCEDDGEPIDEEEMNVKVHWFLRPTELATFRARRDHVENEIYYSLSSTTVLKAQSILSRCLVSSKKVKEPSSSQPSHAHEPRFFCNSAIDARQGLYYKINWDEHHRRAMHATDADGASWTIKVKAKRRYNDEDSCDEVESADEYKARNESDEDASSLDGQEISTDGETSINSGDEEDSNIDRIQRTPRKRRTQAAKSTPRKRNKKTVAAPTPHSRAALRARSQRKTRVTVPAPDQTNSYLDLQADSLPDDPWLRALQVLHVGSRPDVLPCREEEFGRILRSVEALLDEGSGGCIYISGVPGTGKTATVHRVVRELKRMAERNESNPFTYVEINGLKIPEPSSAYTLLWEALSGQDVAEDGHIKISAKEALKQLTKYFSGGARAGPGEHACIVLMDELDQLMTQKQDVIYNFFNWPTLMGSKLVVLAVANTMDLPERAMTGRVRSRLGMERINFSPYKHQELVEIVNSRLESVKAGFQGNFPQIFRPDGLRFAAQKVASISGDARRVLDICRRAVELVQPKGRPVVIEDVKTVVNAMQNSPTAAFLKECSLHEQIMLASILKCIKRLGVEEIKWDDIQHQHLIYTSVLPGQGDSQVKPGPADLRLVLDSLLASHAILMEDGPVVARKPEGERKIVLNIEQGEVQRVLSDISSQWKNALGM